MIKSIYNSFYIPCPLTEEQKSRFLKYWQISKPNYATIKKINKKIKKKKP